MIGTIDVTVQAARPDLPLPPVRAFVGSPSSVRVRNVPRRIGEWDITRVFVTANYPDSTTETAECVLTGGVWVGTVLGCATPGTSLSGFVVNADGVDEFGQPVVGYILGIGDVEVLTREQSVTPGVITFKGDKGDKGDPGEKGEKGDPGEGAVNSVNGKVGDVVLDAHDVGAYTQSETDDKITRFVAHYLTDKVGGRFVPFATHARLADAKAHHSEANPRFFYAGQGFTPTKNDYCVVLADETVEGKTTRYSYVGDWPTGSFQYQYTINDTAFSEAQWAAINSGVTDEWMASTLSAATTALSRCDDLERGKADAGDVQGIEERVDDLERDKADAGDVAALADRIDEATTRSINAFNLAQAVDEIVIKPWSRDREYAVGDLVTRESRIWMCKTEGQFPTWNYNRWLKFVAETDLDTALDGKLDATAQAADSAKLGGSTYAQVVAAAASSAAGSIPYTITTSSGSLTDRAVNVITASGTALTITPPAAVSGKVRDFVVRINCTAATTINWAAFGACEVRQGDSWADMQTVEAGKGYIYRFTDLGGSALFAAREEVA